MSKFYKLKINHIEKETESCVSVGFEVPSELQDIFSFKAGQYITLKKDFNGEEVRRDYSLCVTPQSGELKVAVKEVENGMFSQFANRELKIGDVLDVAPPSGRFIFEPDSSNPKTLVAFAAGSGITPIMSIAKTVLAQEPNSNFILVYGNKSPKQTMFYNELLKVQKAFSDRFEVQFVFSQSHENNALFGRIDKSAINFALKNKLNAKKVDAFFLCGPEDMIHTVNDVLKEKGADKNIIFYELFTTSSSKPNIDSTLVDGKTKITVLVDDEETTFDMSQKQTILEAALDHKVDAPYSCQGGICSSCLARITEGKATMRQNNILTDGEVAEGLILTCQAQPTTATIFVDYDDV